MSSQDRTVKTYAWPKPGLPVDPLLFRSPHQSATWMRPPRPVSPGGPNRIKTLITWKMCVWAEKRVAVVEAVFNLYINLRWSCTTPRKPWPCPRAPAGNNAGVSVETIPAFCHSFANLFIISQPCNSVCFRKTTAIWRRPMVWPWSIPLISPITRPLVLAIIQGKRPLACLRRSAPRHWPVRVLMKRLLRNWDC